MTQEETAFYNGPGAYVSTTRAVIAGVTYPIAAISSVRVAQAKSSGLAFLLLFVGFVWAAGSFSANAYPSAGVAIFLMVIGIAMILRRQYTLLLTTTGREQTALKGEYPVISAISEAINNAIDARG